MKIKEADQQQKYEGSFNISKELTTLYRYAYTEKQAFKYMLEELRKKYKRNIPFKYDSPSTQWTIRATGEYEKQAHADSKSIKNKQMDLPLT